MMISPAVGATTFDLTDINDKGRRTNIAANIKGTNKPSGLCTERERGRAYAAPKLSKTTARLALMAMITGRSSPAAKDVSARRG